MNEEYFQQQFDRVRKLFAPKHNAFGSRDAFAAWYVDQLKAQDCKCYYCGTSIKDIQRLIDAGKLRTRKVRGTGVRGPVLEIDKMANPEGYLQNNCILSCYYCNNDKSYTLDAEEYKEFFGVNRGRYFQHLIGTIQG